MSSAVPAVRRFDLVERVRRATRNSPWLVIAVMLHAILFAALSIVYVTRALAAKEERPIKVEVRSRPPTADVEALAPPEPMVKRDEVPPDRPVELVPDDRDAFFLPSDSTEAPDPYREVGDPDALSDLPHGSAISSTAIGPGGPGQRGSGPTAFYGSRNTAGFVDGGGGRPAPEVFHTEKAVLEGLRWLLRHQDENGSWSAATLREHCSAEAPCTPAEADRSPAYDPGLTGLALLTFLGHGLTQESKAIITDTAMGRTHVTGEAVGRGLRWLIGEIGPDGSFENYAGSLYNEAIGALALAEAYGISGNKTLRQPAQRMIDHLVAAQKTNPTGSGRWGWRYTPGGDAVADMSVTGWVVMALKSARMSGLRVPQDALDGALQFSHWVTGEDGLVGYVDPAAAGQPVSGHDDHFDYHVGTMSALGMLTRAFVAHDIEDPFLELAAARIVQDLPAVGAEGLSIDYYYWYYATLALNQLDGPDSPRHTGRYWNPWNEAMQAALLGLQDSNAERDVCSRGGWLRPDRWSYAGGPIYSTALNVLTLEVYYRYPNAFGQR